MLRQTQFVTAESNLFLIEAFLMKSVKYCFRGTKMLGLFGTLGGSVSRTGVKGVKISRWLSTSPYALSKIIYTECDEAPMLATYSLLPVIQRFAKPMGIEVN